MSAEENMALVRRFLEATPRGTWTRWKEMMAPDFVDHELPPGQEPDREGYIAPSCRVSAAFSDVRFIIEDQVAEGDKVVSRFSGAAPTIEGAYGHRAHRQGADLHGHRHPPHSGGQDRRGVGRGNGVARTNARSV